MNERDYLLRDLLVAVRLVAERFTGRPARRLYVTDDGGETILEIAVPTCACEPPARSATEAVPHGWSVTDRGATFDGTAVPVPGSRLKLLRALVEADGPRTAKELLDLAFDRETSIDNVRYHLRELKRELKKAFTFDGDVIQGDDEGYRLVLR